MTLINLQRGYDGPATPRPTIQTPNTSSFNVNSAHKPLDPVLMFCTPKTDMDESSLFIKPDEFHTIFISVISTIHVDLMNQTLKKVTIQMLPLQSMIEKQIKRCGKYGKLFLNWLYLIQNTTNCRIFWITSIT